MHPKIMDPKFQRFPCWYPILYYSIQYTNTHITNIAPRSKVRFSPLDVSLQFFSGHKGVSERRAQPGDVALQGYLVVFRAGCAHPKRLHVFPVLATNKPSHLLIRFSNPGLKAVNWLSIGEKIITNLKVKNGYI